MLRQGVQGISDLITVNGLINLDFADVKTVMSNAGSALMGIGRASGENRAVEAAQQSIESPLLEVSIDGARGILFNVIGGNDMTMHEINAAAEAITAAADPDANIIFGATINPDLQGEMIITVVATGFDAAYFQDRGASVVGMNSSVSDSALTDVVNQTTEDDVKEIDMDIKQQEVDPVAEDFQKDNHGPSIWHMNDDKHNEEMKNDHDDKSASDFFGSDDKKLEDDLEKPSFLRRLKRQKTDDKDGKKDNKIGQ